MERDLVIALFSCVGSFFILLIVFARLSRVLSVEIPDFLGFIIGLAIIIGLYIKRDFFFGGNPIVTGVTIGIILSLLWNIRYTGFMDAIIRTTISFRFVLWIAATGAGIYRKDIVINLWNKYIVFGAVQLRPYILAVIIVLYVLGTLFLLFPEFYIRNTMKNDRFTFNREVPKPRKILFQTISAIVILICSTLLPEAILFIYHLFV